MTTKTFIDTQHKRIQGVVNWIIATARTKPKEEVVTAMMNRISSSSSLAHPTVRTYLETRRLKPMLPVLTGMITDLYVARTSPSAAARNTATLTLRPMMEQLRTTLRELGEYAMPMTMATWCREELQLVLLAVFEGGGENGQMTQQEIDDLLSDERPSRS